MDNINQAGKSLRKSSKEASHNARRLSENFPLVERAVDSVGPIQPFKKEFRLSDHPHSVRLNVGVKELQKPCELNPIDEYLACETLCGNPGAYYPAPHSPADGQEYPLFYDGFASNVGGFSLPAGGGITIPLSGIYNIQLVINFGSVSIDPASWISVSIRRNGGILNQAIAVAGCGLCAFFPSFNIYAIGVYCNAGDVVGGWAGASSGLPFYTPSNLCGLFHGQPTIVELVALP